MEPYNIISTKLDHHSFVNCGAFRTEGQWCVELTFTLIFEVLTCGSDVVLSMLQPTSRGHQRHLVRWL